MLPAVGSAREHMTVAAQNICYSAAYGENADTKIAAQIGGERRIH